MTTEFNIESLPVKITYVGEVFKPDWGDKGQTVDQWSVEIAGGAWRTDYFTGLGHRKNRKTMPNDWRPIKSQPVKPTIADVLHCLLMDAEAADMNFSDWCESGGYSDDSISALNTYQACVKTGTLLRKHFTREVLEQIRTATEDL